MTVTDLAEDPGAAPAGPADPAPALVERIRRGVVGDHQVLEGRTGRGGSSTPTGPPRAGRSPSSRLSFSYFIADEVAGFLVEAVDLLATSGHRLLADYRFDPRSGHRRHRDAPADPVLSLPDLLDGRPAPEPAGDDDLAGQLERARTLLGAARPADPEAGPSWLPPELERLRDFHLPTTA